LELNLRKIKKKSVLFENRTENFFAKLRIAEKSFFVSLRSSEAAVAISTLMILKSPRRFAFAKLIAMT